MTVYLMSINDAFSVSLLGLMVGFAVLASIMGMSYLLRYVTSKIAFQASSDNPQTSIAPKTAKESMANKVPAAGSLGEVALNNVDEKTAALLMAIVADEIGAPLNELRFISIRELHKSGK